MITKRYIFAYFSALSLLSGFQLSYGLIGGDFNYLEYVNPGRNVTPAQFIKAAYKDDIQTVVDFMGNGHNVNVSEQDGTTALHNAVHQMNTELSRLLLSKNNININAQDKFGYTALHWAAVNGDEEIIPLLLSKANINIDAQDKSGKTALHLAAARGYAAITAELLVSGARMDITDDSGLTPLQVSKQKHKDNVSGTINAFIESQNPAPAAPVAAPAAIVVPVVAPVVAPVVVPVVPVAQQDADECPICLDECDNMANCTTLACNHVFHNDCIQDHIDARGGIDRAQCPMCLRPVVIQQ